MNVRVGTAEVIAAAKRVALVAGAQHLAADADG